MKISLSKRKIKNPFRFQKFSKEDASLNKNSESSLVGKAENQEKMETSYCPYDEDNISKGNEITEDSREHDEARAVLACTEKREEEQEGKHEMTTPTSSMEVLTSLITDTFCYNYSNPVNEDEVQAPTFVDICVTELGTFLCDPLHLNRPIPVTEEDSKPRLTGAHIYKMNSQDKIGITFMTSTNDAGIFIKDVKISSRVKSDSILSGNRIVSINGITCPTTVQAVTELLNQAEGDVKFITAAPNDPVFMEAESASQTLKRDRSVLFSI